MVREGWHSEFQPQFDLPEKLIEGREEICQRAVFRDWSINKYLLSNEEVGEHVRAYTHPVAQWVKWDQLRVRYPQPGQHSLRQEPHVSSLDSAKTSSRRAFELLGHMIGVAA